MHALTTVLSGLDKRIQTGLRDGEYDGSVEEGSAMDQWGKLFHEAGRKTGRSFRVYEDELQKKAMEAAGFVDIQVWEFKVRTFDQVSRRVAAGFMAEGRALYDVYD